MDPKPKRDLSAWFHDVSKNNSKQKIKHTCKPIPSIMIDLILILVKNILSLDFGTSLLSTSTNY